MPENEAPFHRMRPHRAPLTLPCDIRQGQRPWAHSRLLNLSESGFCVEWLPACDPQRGLWLRIPGLELLKANVRWRREGMMGCEFEGRLHAAVFDHIVRQANAAHGSQPAQLWPA